MLRAVAVDMATSLEFRRLVHGHLSSRAIGSSRRAESPIHRRSAQVVRMTTAYSGTTAPSPFRTAASMVVFLSRHWVCGSPTPNACVTNVQSQEGINMSATSRVAGAIAAGYALGRFKKLRLAVLVGSTMASPKFRSAAAGMIQDRLPGGTVVGTASRTCQGPLPL